MARPKPINYDPPLDLSKLPAPSSITKRDKLKLLDDLRNHAGGFLAAGINRVTFNAIERDVRIADQAQRNSAPAETRALPRTEESGEGGSSIAQTCLERKIRIRDDVIHVFHNIGAIDIRKNDEHFLLLTPDEADQLAHALTELAGDLRQDANARAWSQDLLEQQR